MTTVTSLASKKIKTSNIANSISKFAAENLLEVDEYTFDINGVDTYIKTTANDDFVLYKEDIHGYYKDRDKIINEHVRFKQMFIITIKEAKKQPVILKYDLVYSENNVDPYVVIHPESKIPYKQLKPKDLHILLFKELNKIKAYKKILVNIFDTQMREKLKAFVKHIYAGKFKKKIKIPLFHGISPELTKNSKLIMHFLNKETTSQVIEVDEGDLLVEFIKPVYGKNGLNAFGEIISNNYEKNEEDLEVEIDTQTIEIVEDDKKKLYKSKIKGYVHFDESRFYVDNKIKMKTLSRNQEKIANEEDNNIEVIISQNDTNIDSLGEGVELVSETININGHVGAKTKLEATNLVIEGATHGESYQEAKFAHINRHKGTLRCHSAHIKLLEGGEVHATNVEIDTAMGGAIYAENVIINNVKNNLKVYAANSIKVKRVLGEDNLFKINYIDIPTLNSKYNFISKEIDELKEDLEGAMKHSPQNISTIKQKIKELKDEIYNIENSVKNAKITVEEPFNGLNTITFTINSDDELTFKTEAKKYEPFYLEETENFIKLHPTDKKISK
jgi:molybdopterin-binding protein